MNWIEALTKLKTESQGYVLMTVMNTRGSSPRDAGTKMVVAKDDIFDTIGGGALEHQSIEIARELLSSDQPLQHTQSFNLGKDLKQCCGGVVSVFFEVFPASNFILNIFGAGHIGQAISKILTDVDCQVNLFDSRIEMLQQSYPEHIRTSHLTAPELTVEACPANSYFLVMTHDHALDQQLCEAILARGDSRYCGVIGSRTKGIKFRQRLKKKGFTQHELAQLSCPMGLSDLSTKKPMEIAVSVIAELLMIRDSTAQNTVHTNKQLNREESTVIHLESRE